MDLFNKKVLVVGLGMTGVATARFLKNMGAVVTVTDMAKEDELGDSVAIIRELGINMEFGSHENNTFENADLIVLSPGVPHTIPQVQRAIDKGIDVLGEIELASKFIDQPVIAITGTNGKTTTTTLLGEMLKSSGFNVFVGGNIGSPLIGYVDRGKKAEIIIVEVSSFQLDTIEHFKMLIETKSADEYQLVSRKELEDMVSELDRLNKIIEIRSSPPHELFQLLIILEKHLNRGDKLKKQGADWNLFAPDGEGLTSAYSIYGLLMNSHFKKLTARKD